MLDSEKFKSEYDKVLGTPKEKAPEVKPTDNIKEYAKIFNTPDLPVSTKEKEAE